MLRFLHPIPSNIPRDLKDPVVILARNEEERPAGRKRAVLRAEIADERRKTAGGGVVGAVDVAGWSPALKVGHGS